MLKKYKLNINIFLVLSLTLLLILISCNKKDNGVDEKQRVIDSLKSELNKETDKKLFDAAYNLMQDHSYDMAINKFREMKSKYPYSELVKEADKNISLCNDKIKEIYKEEKANLDILIKKCSKIDVEDAITELKSFENSDKPLDLKNIASKELEKYEKEYEKVKVEREAQKKSGIQIVSVDSEWEMSGGYLDRPLLTPHMKIKLKNISTSDIERLEVIVQFIDKGKQEVFGEGSDYIIGYSDPPLSPGFAKTAFITCSVGFKSDLAALNLPSLTARIFIEPKGSDKILFKEVSVKKTYMGMDFDKK
ncbi:MAG: hypothetical protein ABI543_08420 [Ignavibacteria bacterium]